MTPALVLALVAALAAPLIVFRGVTLRRYIAFDLVSYPVALALWWIASPFDLYLGAVAFGVFKLAAFSIALAAGDDVRWSATRAAIVAAFVYAAVIPTQMRMPIDGDEPYYLLITESLVCDRDLDLANQYADLARSATGRSDLAPQSGDPVGPHGEQYSRHEPFLPLLLVPGYMVAGLTGALCTMALFGVLLVRSTVRFLEDEGISDRTARMLIPLFAFGPPVVFYATRIWPEVPGAFFFLEAVRGVRNRRWQRWLPALFGLVMLKLRFVLAAIILVGRAAWTRKRIGIVGLLILIVPLAIVWLISGSLFNVHAARELLPFPPQNYLIGLSGLLVDGAAGFLFQAPLYMAGIFALASWKSMPAGFRLGMSAALLYVLYLIPRSEWHGGWSPPLRYVVFLTPVLLLGVAAMVEQSGRLPFSSIVTLWTIGLTIHGLAYPWRLFHIANGENAVGEWLSRMYGSDFSRLFPSLIRPNFAAIVASALVVVAIVASLRPTLAHTGALRYAAIPLTALLVALAFVEGRKPGSCIELEDAHVMHEGGELYPEIYTVARFRFRGGWVLHPGQRVSFLARPGAATLQYASPEGAIIEIGRDIYPLAPTGSGYGEQRMTLLGGRSELRCVAGIVNLDRIDSNE